MHSNNGFTLIELLVTLAVAAIVLGIAIPSFNTQILNNRSIVLGEDFASAINFARSEAVKRGKRVTLCASSDGSLCNGSDWVDGFIVVVDHATTDKASAPVLTDSSHSDSTILRVWDKQDPRSEIAVTRGKGDVTFLRYTSLGTLARIDENPIIIEAKLKKCTGDAARTITIGLSGLVSMERKACTVN
jgi:type IV fimbrial biogenesis protein FimT